MGQEDLYQSDFYEDNNRFSDVFNGVLFHGEDVMKPEELETEDSVMVSIRGTRKGKKVICDKIRRWKGRYVSLLILESQSYVDYRMILRVMEAEVMGYDKQRKEAYQLRRSNKEKFDRHEYLSRMKRDQKFVPIITLIIYVGKNRLWDGARHLHELLDVDEEIRPFVNDYRLNLFDYHDYKNFHMFKTENRLLFQALSGGNSKKRMKKLLQEDSSYAKLDEETVRAILGILGVKSNINKIKYYDEEGNEVYDMCKAFDDYKEEGKREGKREGRREGMQEMAMMIRNLMKNQKVTFEVAAEMTGISKGKQKQLKTLI